MSFVDFLPVVILAAHLFDKWYLSRGSLLPVYILTISGSITTILYNILLLAAMEGNHKSILLFSLNSSWTIIMSVCGLIRLFKESKLKRLPAIRSFGVLAKNKK